MSIPSIADQLAALRASEERKPPIVPWEFTHGVVHIFACDSCRLERKWGHTNVRTEREEVHHPLLICDTCTGHTPHTFKRYQ